MIAAAGGALRWRRRIRVLARVFSALAIAGVTLVMLLAAPRPARAQSPQALVDRGEADFAANHLTDALADFDTLRALVPSEAALIWQRGIVLYELGRFDDCAAQFAAYHAANPDDLESVAWHFLCTARATSPAHARAVMLPGGSDPRIMRGDVYEMLHGDLSIDDLLTRANESVPTAQFYAHLYVGLYLETLGDRVNAAAHLAIATSSTYQTEGGFMNVVARVHLANLKWLMASMQ